MRAYLTVCIVLVLAGTLWGCAKGQQAPNEAQVLAEVGFERPVTVQVRLNVSASLEWPDNENTQRVALFQKLQMVTIVPHPNAAPWYRWEAQVGEINGQAVTIPVGKRVISNRSEVRRWTEGSIRYFAETINYTVEPDDRFKGSLGRGSQLSSIRLVLANDPAVGHWVISPQSDLRSLENDAAGLTGALAAAGAQYVSEIPQVAENARHQAFDMIAADLASKGVIAPVVDNPDILVSRANGLAYYKKSRTFGHVDPESRDRKVTLGEMASFCAGLRTSRYRNWRLPTSNEMKAIISYSTPPFIDVPDRRLWGAEFEPESGKMTEYFTRSIVSNRKIYNMEQAPAGLISPQVITLQISRNGVGFSGQGQYLGRQYDRMPIDRIEIDTVGTETKVVCVADAR